MNFGPRDTSTPLRPLPTHAAQLLQQVAAPPRLVAHHQLVHEVALLILATLHSHWPTLPIDAQSVTFGAATHDIGKVMHPQELHAPGRQHERAGKDVLLQLGVEPALARFTVTHAGWHDDPVVTLEDLLVALADTIWKGKRNEPLEQHITERLTQITSMEFWDVFIKVSDMIETIGNEAAWRLAWQAQFPLV